VLLRAVEATSSIVLDLELVLALDLGSGGNATGSIHARFLRSKPFLATTFKDRGRLKKGLEATSSQALAGGSLLIY